MTKQANNAFVKYTHIDGFQVTQQTHESIEVDAFELVVSDDERDTIRFGETTPEQKANGETGVWKFKGAPSREECDRTFAVNYIQGIDALVARHIVVEADKMGLRGIQGIHDCFRTTASDAPKLRVAIERAYNNVFVDGKNLSHLSKQLGTQIDQPALPKAKLFKLDGNATYFCQ